MAEVEGEMDTTILNQLKEYVLDGKAFWPVLTVLFEGEPTPCVICLFHMSECAMAQESILLKLGAQLGAQSQMKIKQICYYRFEHAVEPIKNHCLKVEVLETEPRRQTLQIMEAVCHGEIVDLLQPQTREVAHTLPETFLAGFQRAQAGQEKHEKQRSKKRGEALAALLSEQQGEKKKKEKKQKKKRER